MMDVKKQKDMSGFYRHLLNQQTGEESNPTTIADKRGVKYVKSVCSAVLLS